MRSFARGALAAYVLVMAVLFAWPNGWAINRITVWFYTRFLPYLGPQVLPEHYGLLFNVLAFTALVVLVCTAFTQLRVHRVVALAIGVSALVEIGQALLLPGREAVGSDLATNAAGALLGGLIVTGWRRAARARSVPQGRPAR